MYKTSTLLHQHCCYRRLAVDSCACWCSHSRWLRHSAPTNKRPSISACHLNRWAKLAGHWQDWLSKTLLGADNVVRSMRRTFVASFVGREQFGAMHISRPFHPVRHSTAVSSTPLSQSISADTVLGVSFLIPEQRPRAAFEDSSNQSWQFSYSQD